MIKRVPFRVLQLMVVIAACNSPPSQSSGAEHKSIAGATNTTAVSETTLTSARVVQSGRFVDTVASAFTPKLPLVCSPTTLSRRDTLSLSMKTPHGNYLTVNAPDGTAFFIIYPQLGDSTRKYSLIPSETFRHISRLRLPADVQANPRVYGRPNLGDLFTKPGKYVFQMGDNLEGDFGEQVHRCTVQFTASKN